MGLSKPVYEGKVKIIYPRVAMRDGVELATKITMPDAEGRFPAVMMYHPYRGVREPLADYRDERPMFVPYLAERGYAIVQYDVRGTGNSGGWSKDIYSDDERRDGYEMVEWIARQPWSNGNVGMTGISYGGVVQWQVAVQNPPSLKTIIVRSANDSVYTEWTYPGGSLRPYMFDTYSPLMTAYNFAPPDPEIAGEKWSDIWQTRLDHNRPWGIGYISHQQEGPYWQDRSLSADYSRVKCPVFVIAGLGGRLSDGPAAGLLQAGSQAQEGPGGTLEAHLGREREDGARPADRRPAHHVEVVRLLAQGDRQRGPGGASRDGLRPGIRSPFSRHAHRGAGLLALRAGVAHCAGAVHQDVFSPGREAEPDASRGLG